MKSGKYDEYDIVESGTNTMLVTDSIASVLKSLPNVLSAPFFKYFIIKSQKELTIKRLDDYAELRKYILDTIKYLSSDGTLTESLQADLMAVFHRTFELN